MEDNMNKPSVSRRDFLRRLAMGAGADYAARKQQFLEDMRKALPNAEAWARSCADCEECLPKCPQQIRIPNQMSRIVELLRR